jgi:hypothetical protein
MIDFINPCHFGHEMDYHISVANVGVGGKKANAKPLVE